MLFLGKLVYYTGYFLPMIIFLIIAIVAAKSKGAWALYGIGAVVQLLSLIGGSKTAAMRGESMALEWVIYIALLILVAVLINNRYNKAKEEEYRRYKQPRPSVMQPKPASEQPPAQQTGNDNRGKELRFCKKCGGMILTGSAFCSRCGEKVEQSE